MSARTLQLAALFLDYPDGELYAMTPELADSAALTVYSNDPDEPSVTAWQYGNGKAFSGFYSVRAF